MVWEIYLEGRNFYGFTVNCGCFKLAMELMNIQWSFSNHKWLDVSMNIKSSQDILLDAIQ